MQRKRTVETWLRAERARLVEQAHHTAGAQGERDADMADGSATFEQERQLAIATKLRAKLQEVDRALAKLDEGTYGSCDSCGAAIPAERLEILPQATLCVTCKSQR